MKARIHYGVEICAELCRIDPGGSSCSIRYDRARYEATTFNGSQFSDWRSVSAHDDRTSALHLT
jgi:hypothetical protein